MGEGLNLGRAPLVERLRTAPVEHVAKNLRANRAPHGDEVRLFVAQDFAPDRGPAAVK